MRYERINASVGSDPSRIALSIWLGRDLVHCCVCVMLIYAHFSRARLGVDADAQMLADRTNCVRCARARSCALQQNVFSFLSDEAHSTPNCVQMDGSRPADATGLPGRHSGASNFPKVNIRGHISVFDS